MIFRGPDRYLWLEKTVKLPEAREGSEVTGLFDSGKPEAGITRALNPCYMWTVIPFRAWIRIITRGYFQRDGGERKASDLPSVDRPGGRKGSIPPFPQMQIG